MKLQDKVIAITGAGGIICSEFAKALAKEGAKVALLDINYDAAKKYADEHPEQPKFVMINAWNEWTEGMYLIPEKHIGSMMLDTIRTVLKEQK